MADNCLVEGGGHGSARRALGPDYARLPHNGFLRRMLGCMSSVCWQRAFGGVFAYSARVVCLLHDTTRKHAHQGVTHCALFLVLRVRACIVLPFGWRWRSEQDGGLLFGECPGGGDESNNLEPQSGRRFGRGRGGSWHTFFTPLLILRVYLHLTHHWSCLRLRSSQKSIMSMIDVQLVLEAGDGNMRGVEKMLAAGACVNGSPHLPARPLVAAAQAGQIGVLEMLVGRGADLEVTGYSELCDNDGETHFPPGLRALHAAASAKQVGSVRCLLKAGANPDVLNSEGFTPLMLAHQSPEVVAELLKGGANPAFSNDDGAIALHAYALTGAQEAMKRFLESAPSLLNQVWFPRYVQGTAALRKTPRITAARLTRSLAVDTKHSSLNTVPPYIPLCCAMNYFSAHQVRLHASVLCFGSGRRGISRVPADRRC